MLVCDGSVTTLWACAAVNTRPPAASRSSSGVGDGRRPPNPGASARSVSMVTRSRSRGDGAAAVPAPAGRPPAVPAAAAAAAASTATSASPSSTCPGQAAVRRPVAELMTGESKTRRAQGNPRARAVERDGRAGLAEAQGGTEAEDPRREHFLDVFGRGHPGVALALQDGVVVQQVEAVEADGQAEVVELEVLADAAVEHEDVRVAELGHTVGQQHEAIADR